ncbi:MAG: translesion DNA synthesis-associated protein ImuA [Gammaproteobacteria bacterium]
MNRAGLQPLLRDPRLWRGSGAAEIKAAPTGHAALDAVLPGGGWPRGALSEILHPFPGVGELTLALPLLVGLTQQPRSIALLAPPQLPAAPAWADAGVALARMLVVQPQADADALWAAEQLLHAGAGAVLLWRERIDPTALRRLQLAAEAGDGIGLLYRPLAAEREASVAALRLRIERRHGEPQIEVLKCRGARPTGRYALGGHAVSTHPLGQRLSA